MVYLLIEKLQSLARLKSESLVNRLVAIPITVSLSSMGLLAEIFIKKIKEDTMQNQRESPLVMQLIEMYNITEPKTRIQKNARASKKVRVYRWIICKIHMYQIT